MKKYMFILIVVAVACMSFGTTYASTTPTKPVIKSPVKTGAISPLSGAAYLDFSKYVSSLLIKKTFFSKPFKLVLNKDASLILANYLTAKNMQKRKLGQVLRNMAYFGPTQKYLSFTVVDLVSRFDICDKNTTLSKEGKIACKTKIIVNYSDIMAKDMCEKQFKGTVKGEECQCPAGYSFNTTQQLCIIKICLDINSTSVGGACACKPGYHLDAVRKVCVMNARS